MTTIYGSIDNVTVVDPEKILVGGWACALDETGGRHPCQYFTNSFSSETPIDTNQREDFCENGLFGFHFVVSNPQDLAQIIYSPSPVISHYGEAQAPVKPWEKVLPELEFAMIALLVGKNTSFRHRIHDLSDKSKDIDYNEIIPEVSLNLTRVGSISPDETAIIGRNGYLFLFKGSNNAHAIYDTASTSQNADEWHALITSRRLFCETLGITYLQIIIPEKQSILHEYYPYESVSGPSNMLAELAQRFGTDGHFLNMFDPLRFCHTSQMLPPYRSVDSHLSIHGVKAVVCSILTALELQTNLDFSALTYQFLTGDLGLKFPGLSFAEDVHEPAPGSWALSNVEACLTYQIDPKDGHTGSIYEWTCNDAPFDKAVIIFGNSMFERGGSPLSISWWFCRLFAKTRFVWNSTMNQQMIHDFKPDIVICQTVERFMRVVPVS